MNDAVHRFLLEELDIRGSVVQIETVWQQIKAQHDYPAQVAELLGQMCAITSLIAANLKQAGRLTFQLRGHGDISILVLDCSESLNLRGYAKHAEALAPQQSLRELFGDGQLLMSLEQANARQPYQSFVPLEGDSIGDIFQHYLEQSEQQPAILILAANDERAAGLFLQKLPGADLKDEDGWNRVEMLLNTVKPAELLETEPVDLLQKVFAEEQVRIFEPKPVEHDFPPDWEKIRDMLRSIGKAEVESILAEHGEILVHDDLSNQHYRFSPEEALAIFNPPSIH